MCGIRTSSRTRSGVVLPTSGSTCVPDCVSPTISKPPSASSARLIPSRTSRWSSAITTRTATSVAQGPDAASALTRPRDCEGPRPGEPVRPSHRYRPSSEGLLLPKSGDTLRRRSQITDPGLRLKLEGEAHRVRIEFRVAKGENGDGEGGHPQAAFASRATRRHRGSARRSAARRVRESRRQWLRARRQRCQQWRGRLERARQPARLHRVHRRSEPATSDIGLRSGASKDTLRRQSVEVGRERRHPDKDNIATRTPPSTPSRTISSSTSGRTAFSTRTATRTSASGSCRTRSA